METAFNARVGQVWMASRGMATPALVNDILRAPLGG
jgi:Asp-tRNA(Asn)/Glu-tRNA(Gln) amidotransferase B subunit